MSPSAQRQWTVLELLNWTREHFARAGVDSPRLAAEMLLAHALHCHRIDLYTRFDHRPGDEQRAVFRQLVLRAARHEPVAYLVGCKEFYSLPFRITPDVLVPRAETELLVGEATAHLRSLGRPARAWDVCTGSGCVAVALAVQVRDAAVLATDVSAAAVAVAAENAAAHHLADRVRCRQADLLELPPDCPDWACADVITANPPYVPDGAEVAPEVLHEPAAALRAGPDGLEVIRRLVPAAPGSLAVGGALVMEFGHGQADAVWRLLKDTGAFAEPRVLRDHQGIERAAVAIKQG